MNPERPTDPREQLEVRITALLLGEASAFEEAELLEAIKHDPKLEAYYEEMRGMVKQVEAAIQLAPVESPTSQPQLADARRDQLQELFKQPAPAKTIKLESPAGRVRRLGWLQHAAAIAAAMVILAAVVWMLVPGYSKAKSKASVFSMLMPQEPLIDQLGGSRPSAAATTWGMSTNRSVDRRSADFFPESTVESRPQPGSAGEEPESLAMDERFLARYGSSRSRAKVPAKDATSPAQEPAVAARKPAGIYLPPASVDTAGVPVHMYADGAERGVAVDNTVRYYFRDSGLAAAKDPAPGEVAAVVTDSPTLAFAVPDVSAVAPKPAPIAAALPTLQTQAGRPEVLADSLARKGDTMAESEVVLGKKLAAPAPEPAVKSEVMELRSVLTAEAKSSTEDETRPRQLSAAESRFNDFDDTTLSAGGVRGRAAGASRGAQVDGLAALGSVANPEPDRGQPRAGSIFGDRNGGGGFGVGGVGGRAGASRGWEVQGASDEHLLQNAKLLGEMGRSREAEQMLRGAAQANPANTELAYQRDLAQQQRYDVGAQVRAYDSSQQIADLERAWQEPTSSGVVAGQPAAPGGPANAPAAAGEAFAYFDAPAPGAPVAAFGNEVHAANTWHADFGTVAAAPAVESFGRAVAADDFVVNGQVATDLFAKQQADTKWVERLERRDGETSLGLAFQEAKVPVEAMYKERLLTEGRQLDRARVKELSDQLAVRGEGVPLTEIELKRKAAEPEWLGFLGQTNVGTDRNSIDDRFALALNNVPTLGDMPIVGNPFKNPRGTQSRFDTLADFSSSEFAMVADNGREQQVQQQVATASVAAPEVTKLAEELVESQPATPPPPSLEPLPEIRTADNAFSTFSLNVSDVSFQLAASSLENGQLPDGAQLRSEEFINAFDYRDPAPAPGQRVAFNWERARNPFAHNRELLRLSVQTAAAGREPGQPLNLVLLLDNSGSMERADRVQITEQMLRVLAAGLNDYDRISVISFARTPRLIVDGLPGGNHQALLDQITGLNPDGGTNLEDALKLGYETAAKHFQASGNNRVILITDGAANLGNVDPAQLRERVIDQRKRGIALDCFGVGWEGYNDNLLESLSRNGDGRYGFLNDAENAVFRFSSQLAGALQVAAADVKAQVEFNPNRVTVYRQIGYQQHQLTKEQFRDNTVDAAELGAAEAGNALYSVEVNPNGSGPIGTFRARYRVPSTGQYEEKEWVLDYTPAAPELETSGPAMRLASTSAAFAEWLANSPYAQTVTPDALQNLLRDVPEAFAPDPRPAKLQAMIQQARAIGGR